VSPIPLKVRSHVLGRLSSLPRSLALQDAWPMTVSAMAPAYAVVVPALLTQAVDLVGSLGSSVCAAYGTNHRANLWVYRIP
jgi:hypothetical protein